MSQLWIVECNNLDRESGYFGFFKSKEEAKKWDLDFHNNCKAYHYYLAVNDIRLSYGYPIVEPLEEIYTLSNSEQDSLDEAVRRYVEGYCQKHNLDPEKNYIGAYPTIVFKFQTVFKRG